MNATWKLALVAVVGSVTGCGHAPSAPRSRLTPKQIVANSKPAIVRIEVGTDRVGTGFVIDKTGLVATNFHVVAGSDDIRVTLLGGKEYPVQRIVGFDQVHDLALLDIDPPDAIATLPLGDSSAVSPGDPVLAIGNPLGVLDYTVSDGLLSAVRVLSPEFTLLQISAPISQGSSGGPLFNSYGEVIGIVNAFLGGGQNLNFAIPAIYLEVLARTSTPPLTTADFKQKTRASEPAGTEDATGDDADVKIVRHVPNHDMAILDGCKKEVLADVANAIGEAIELGAPLYNDGKIEACFRIYEAVVIRYERDFPCAGVRSALGDGLQRVETVKTAKQKAWVLRDTFDGLLDVIVRKARTMSP